MDYFRVKNWERFQHYKHRNPPWIKLYTNLLDDYEFACLQDASKLLALYILMLAAKANNKLPLDPTWIQHKTGLEQLPDLQPLFTHGFISKLDASEMLASCKQNALSEKSREERKTEDLKVVSSEFRAKSLKADMTRHTEAQRSRIAATKT